MNFKFIVTVFFVVLSHCCTAQYHIQRNTAYLEFLGVGEFYTVNLDHIINEFHHNSSSFRVGTAFRPGNSVYLTSGLNLMHGLKRQRDRYLEMGAGGVYVNRYAQQASKHDAYGYLSFGYRKQGTKKDPLFWKVALTPLLFRLPKKEASWLGFILPSAGASIGYSF